jgi:molybdopterin-guanine dinucleotide biosynthesis protein A
MESSLITGVILAGGPNTGIAGTLKALLPFGGETLIERQIKTMREICTEIIVVTNTPKPFFRILDSSVRLITDYFPDCGPLGGMHAAFHLARNPLVWIAGCDMPFLSASVAVRLAESRKDTVQAVLPIIRNQPVALHGIYDKGCAVVAAKLLSEGEKDLDIFLAGIRWLGVADDSWAGAEEDDDFTFTIHRQVDYDRARGLLGHEMSNSKMGMFRF